MPACRTMQIQPCLSSYMKFKSKCIKQHTIKSVAINLLEMKKGTSLVHIGTGNNFLNGMPTARVLRLTINRLEHRKLNKFYITMSSIRRSVIRRFIGETPHPAPMHGLTETSMGLSNAGTIKPARDTSSFSTTLCLVHFRLSPLTLPTHSLT